MLNIKVNSKSENIEKSISIEEYLKQKGVGAESVVVLRNSKIIKKHKIKNEMIEEGDELEILRFVGGG